MPVMRSRTVRRTLTMCACVAWIGSVCVEGQSSGVGRVLPSRPAEQPAQAAEPTVNPARALVSKYCVTCHNERLKTANLLLDKADDQIANASDTWEKVVVQLRGRSMPPVNMPRPDNATYDAVASWLESELDRAAAARPNPGRPAGLHRLNRTEYANAVRDLLGIEIDPTSMLPPDAQAHGFDTNADALSVEPALLSTMSDAISSSPAVLFWMIMNPVTLVNVAPPTIEPPVILLKLLPTALVTRMPPEPTTLFEVSVSVCAAESLNRTL